MCDVKALKVGSKWRGFYKLGSYWWPVKKSHRVVTYKTAKAARAAAIKSCPNFSRRRDAQAGAA